jgi:hypothetical protein
MELFMDSYLENAMDYVQETFESANEWMKENDPFPNLGLPVVQAQFQFVFNRAVIDTVFPAQSTAGPEHDELHHWNSEVNDRDWSVDNLMDPTIQAIRNLEPNDDL